MQSELKGQAFTRVRCYTHALARVNRSLSARVHRARARGRAEERFGQCVRARVRKRERVCASASACAQARARVRVKAREGVRAHAARGRAHVRM
eukprot:4150850-Pleurochrysis_carterae.AAC.1